MKRIRLVLAAFAIAVLAAGPARAHNAPPRAPASITILHFNDFHGQVEPLDVPSGQPCGGLPRLAAQVEAERAAAEKRGDAAFLLFAGDLFTGTSFSTLFQGGPEFETLSKIGVAAMVTGNHEWDFGQGVIMTRARHAAFPVVVANVTHPDPEHDFYKPSATLRAGSLRVGVIGVTTADTPVTTAPGNTKGYAFLDPVQAVGDVLKSRQREWDFVIVLSHCGFEVDRAIADHYPQVGLIVGGHDHKVIEEPFVENGVPIVQAGDRGRFLGEVRIELAKGARPKVTGRLIPITSTTAEDPAIRDLLVPYLDKEASSLGEMVGTLPAALSGDRVLLRSQEMPLGDLMADAMRDETKADIALLNAGTLRAGLPAGKVTGRDLLACLPFFDSVCTIRLTGAQVQALLDRCAAMPVEDAPGGFLQVSGLLVRYEGGKALALKVGASPIEPSRDYLVACSHFLLSGGDGLVEFTQGRDVRDWGVGLQELMRRQIAKPDLTIPTAGGRIVRAAAEPAKKAA